MMRWAGTAGVFSSMILLVAGCASITTGTSQTIDLSSSPDGAACTLTRAGAPLGTVTTPGRLSVKRSRDPITVDCTKDGYEDTRTIMNAQAEKATYGNAIMGGIIGMAIDNSTGANSRYDPSVAVELTPLSAADQAAKATARKEAAVKVAPVPGSSGSASPFDGSYAGQVDVLQTNLQTDVPHQRTFAVRVVNGVGTGTVRHALCDEPGEVFFLVEPSGKVRGKANTRNTTGCTDRFAMLEGRVDGDVMYLTLLLKNSPQLALARSADPSPVAAAPVTRSFDGEYRAGLEVAQGDLRQLWIRVRGTRATGTSRVALCPTPGAVSLKVDPSGAISGEADLQTSASCTPRKASLSGHADGPRLVMTANFADGSKPQDFTFNRERRGVGVDD